MTAAIASAARAKLTSGLQAGRRTGDAPHRESFLRFSQVALEIIYGG